MIRPEIARKSRWYYNTETKKEHFLAEPPTGENWKCGRLPYELWTEERKKSYAEKHKSINIPDESRKRMSEKSKIRQTGKVGYTNGIKNIWLRVGQEVPEGFYKGWTLGEDIEYGPSGRRKKQCS